MEGIFGPACLQLYDIATVQPPQAIPNGSPQIMGATAYTINGLEKRIICTASSNVTITLNDPILTEFYQTTFMYIGQQIEIVNYSSTATVTINSISGNVRTLGNSNLVLKGQYARAVLTYLTSSEWLLNTFPPEQPRIQTLTDAIAVQPNTDISDQCELLTTSAIGTTRGISAPAGTAEDGQKLLIRIKQDSVGSRLVSWNTIYHFSTTIPTPTLSTAANKTDYIGFVYNSNTTSWDCIAVSLGY